MASSFQFSVFSSQLRVVAGVVAVVTMSAPSSAATMLQCGRLIDVRAGSVLTNMTVVVDGPAIVRVEKGLAAGAAGDTVVDLHAHTCMPGLMDMHVHLTHEYNENAQIENFTLNAPDYAYRSVGFAEKTLIAGFTSVRDLGGDVNVALRNAINAGHLRGPRVFTSGRSIATTGGHADPTNGMRDDLSKDYGFRVAAHAHGAEGMKRAIRAGVASIEHGTYMDDEAMTLMRQRGTYYVPTIIAGKWVEEKSRVPGFFPEIVRKKAAEIGPLIQETFACAQSGRQNRVRHRLGCVGPWRQRPRVRLHGAGGHAGAGGDSIGNARRGDAARSGRPARDD